MHKEKQVQSLTITSGSRTYFIDVKETTENRKYVSFIESKRMQEGFFEKHRILIFEEDVHKVVSALQAVLQHFSPPVKSSIQAVKDKHPNAFSPWMQEDDKRLEALYREGKTPAELSTIFQRTVGAIQDRIGKLELELKYRQHHHE